MVNGKSQVEKVVSSYIESESVVGAQVACKTEQLVAKDISTLEANSLVDTLQFACKKVRTGVGSVDYKIVERILLDLLHREVMDEILENFIANHSDTSDAADKNGEKLLSKNAFTAPIAAVIRCKAS